MRIAEALGYFYIPEYARIYLEDNNYAFDDVVQIAKSQLQLWQHHDGDVVLDTDVNVLEIWFLERFGKLPDSWNEYRSSYPLDFTFLCAPDIPYEEDPLRENPDDRDRLFDLYQELLEKKNVPYLVLKGDIEQRLEQVLEHIRH